MFAGAGAVAGSAVSKASGGVSAGAEVVVAESGVVDVLEELAGSVVVVEDEDGVGVGDGDGAVVVLVLEVGTASDDELDVLEGGGAAEEVVEVEVAVVEVGTDVLLDEDS